MSTAFTNLQAVPIDSALPSQNTGTAGKALVSNGTNVGWNTILSMIGPGPGQTSTTAVTNALLPPQAGALGKVLSTDGNGVLSWITSGGAAGVTSVTVGGTTYTGAVTISNVPSATTATTAGNVTGTVAIANGGTGATSAVQALTSLGAAAANHTHNYAPTTSPDFLGIPKAPTAAPGTNTTQIATTAFVAAAAMSGPTGYTGSAGPAGSVSTTQGSIGSYVAATTGQPNLTYGATFAGSSLFYVNGFDVNNQVLTSAPFSPALAGTWRNIGLTTTPTHGSIYLFQRIA